MTQAINCLACQAMLRWTNNKLACPNNKCSMFGKAAGLRKINLTETVKHDGANKSKSDR